MADVQLSTLGATIRSAYEGQLALLETIQSAGEFPAPSGGVITLVAGTLYRVNGIIDIGTDRIDMNGATGLFGGDSTHDTISYSGTGDMFTAVPGQNILLEELNIECPNGTMVSMSGGGSSQFLIRKCRLNAIDTLGDIVSPLVLEIKDNFIGNTVTAGFRMLGASGGDYFMEGNTFLNNTGTLFDLTTAIFRSISIRQHQLINTLAPDFFMSGAAASANVTERAILVANNFSGAGTVLDTIDVNDLKWLVAGNQGLTSSEFNASAYISATALTAITDGVPTLIAGTYTEIFANRFTISAAGRITYIGLDDIRRTVSIIINGEPASGNGNVYDFGVAMDGTLDDPSESRTSLDNNKPQTSHTQASILFSTGTFIEPFVTGVGTNIDLTAEKLTILIS